MSFLTDLFATPPVDREHREEVSKLTAELIQIGKTDDYLADHFTAGFNSQFRHVHTREIGKRLDDMGGLPLMQYVFNKVRRKVGKMLGEHLEYAWDGIGKWKA